MKSFNVLFLALLILSTTQAQAGGWAFCGTLNQMTTLPDTRFGIPNFNPIRYEYGIEYITAEPIPVVTTFWNQGVRISNKEPLFTFSDNPSTTMNMGGFVFYRDTLASDDDNCGVGNFRHRYWWNGANNVVSTGFSNGCFGSTIKVYCRLR